MENLREYVVTLYKYEDLDDFYNDMETPGGNLYIPDRAVDLSHRKPISRNTLYYLTKSEAEQIKKDPRVQNVVLSMKEVGMSDFVLYWEQRSTFTKTSTAKSSDKNWGLLRCIKGETYRNQSGQNTWYVDLSGGSDAIQRRTETIKFPLSGKNVDIIIMDANVTDSHPEFYTNPDGGGTSRYNQFNWYSLDPIVRGTPAKTYSYNASYSDSDHGFHVAGTAAGNTQGWAKDASIYNATIYTGDPIVGIPEDQQGISGLDWYLYVFDYFRAFHKNKPINPKTGYRNPTIINNSWGGAQSIPGFWWTNPDNYIIHRGVKHYGQWSSTGNGLKNYTDLGFPESMVDMARRRGQSDPVIHVGNQKYSGWLDKDEIKNVLDPMIEDIRDASAEGIHIVWAAGNYGFKLDVEGGPDADNYISHYSLFELFGYAGYPNRHSILGTKKGVENAIIVGALADTLQETPTDFTGKGPAVDILAPGKNIVSSTKLKGDVRDSRNSNYFLSSYSGTSMAAPQVTGMLACFLELKPDATPQEIMNFIKTESTITWEAWSKKYNIPIDDGKYISQMLYESNNLIGTYNGTTFYGLYRQADIGGLAYWTGEYIRLGKNTAAFNTVKERFFTEIPSSDSQDYPRSRTNNKSFIQTDNGSVFLDTGLGAHTTNIENFTSPEIPEPNEYQIATKLNGAPNRYLFAPRPTFRITADVSLVQRGSKVVYTIYTTDVFDGSVIYLNEIGNVPSSAFTDGKKELQIRIYGQKGTLTRTVSTSYTTASQSTLELRTGGYDGTVQVTSDPVYVNSPTTPVTSYSFALIPNSITEGGTGRFEVSTVSVPNGTTLYWTIVNDTTSNSDFLARSGSFEINNSSGFFDIRPLAEGTFNEATQETFSVQLRTGGTTGPVVATSGSVIVINETIVPTYRFSTVPSSIPEGSSSTITVTTTDVPDNTRLFWTINHGTTAAADFSLNSDSFLINSNTGTFTITPLSDSSSEGNQTFTISIRTLSITNTPVATSGTITVTDPVPVVPTYQITYPTSIDEGTFGRFTVTTTNVADDTTLYWNINNVSTTSADFSSSSGSFKINSNSGFFDVDVLSDFTTETTEESFKVRVFSNSARTTLVAESPTVKINDISKTPTFRFTQLPSSINEGASGSFEIQTTNLPTNTRVYWSINHIGTSSSDFNGTSGSFLLDNQGIGSFLVSVVADAFTEGSEGFSIELKLNTQGSVLYTSDPILISDTSTTPVLTVFEFSIAPTSINEGVTATFEVSTNYTGQLYWSIPLSGNLTSGDFQATQNSFSAAAGKGTFTVTPSLDILTEGSESFQIEIRTQLGGNPVVTSNFITINDSSVSPVYTFSSVPTSINEGEAGTFFVSTTRVSAGTTLYWRVSSNAQEFGVTSGSFTIDAGGNGEFTVTPTADSFTEGSETFSVSIFTDAARNNLVATSNPVTINDTSQSPAAVYQFSSIPSDIDEGASSRINVSTVNVLPGTKLYWKIEENAGDFTTSSGEFTVGQDGTAFFDITPTADQITD